MFREGFTKKVVVFWDFAHSDQQPKVKITTTNIDYGDGNEYFDNYYFADDDSI